LRVVNLAGAKESVQRVVTGDDEAGNVDEELASNVEEDKEEVEAGEAEESVDLGDGRLLFEVVEGGVLGQLEHALSAPQHQQHMRQASDVSMTMDAIVLQNVHYRWWTTNLFVHLGQRLLGAFLGRHGGGWSMLECKVAEK
jgi:hypothetical protein